MGMNGKNLDSTRLSFTTIVLFFLMILWSHLSYANSSAKCAEVIKSSSQKNIATYYRGIQIKSLEDLDLAYNYRKATLHGMDHVSPEWVVAANHAFYFGTGAVSVILEFKIPKSAVKEDGHRGPRAGYIVNLKSLGLTQLSPLVSRIGVIRNQMVDVEKLTDADKEALKLWQSYSGVELIRAIVRDSGPTSALIEWLPEAEVQALIEKAMASDFIN